MLKRILHFVSLPLVVGFAAPGCTLGIEDDHDRYRGRSDYDSTLTAEWTVDGSTDSDACADFGARDLELVIYGRDGFEQEVEEYCEEFEVSIDVPPGRYSIDATLIDRSDRAVTTTLKLDSIRVYEGEEVVIPVDFPPDSLL